MRMTPLRVLLVEDNAADVRLTHEAFLECPLANTLDVMKDGVEAMEHLHRVASAAAGLDVAAAGNFADIGGTRAFRPDVVLLDLNLPRKDGLEVLAEMKADAFLMHIPVVILSTSHADSDVVRCYALHANAYVTKPADVDEFFAAIRAISDFWSNATGMPVAWH